jgi:hypothetical protein
MKKQILKLFIVGFTALAMFSSCNKNNVSQEDVIVNQQLIDLAIRIVDASDNYEPLDSALVEIISGNQILSAATDETGLVFFGDVTISDYTPVTITKTGYASISAELYLTPDDYRQKQITERFMLYPTTGENMVTVEGTLTIESDVTNREREAVPSGLVVRAYNYSMYTDIAFIGETNSDGEYSIQVPVRYTGTDDIQLRYPEIYTNQTVAIENEDDYTISVVERPAYFDLKSSAQNNAIPSVPSAYAVVDAPGATTVGSGFAVGVKPVRIPLTLYSQAILVDGGSGYSDGNDQIINLSTDPSGNAAQIQVDVVDGHIVNIDGFINNSAEYSSAPTINTSVLGGSGAVINILFEGRYRIYITNNGSDYITYPKMYYEYTYYDGTILRETTGEVNLSSYTDLINGMLINDNMSDVDTIFTYSGLASTPTFIIENTPTEQIYLSFDYGDINNMGEITSYNTEASGYGYDPSNPPTLTVNTVAGYGSGAVIDIELNTNGEFSGVDYINRGTGYVDNVNDFDGDGTTGDDEEDPSFSYGGYYDGFRYVYDALPGSSYIRSAHYGTGSPVEDF